MVAGNFDVVGNSIVASNFIVASNLNAALRRLSAACTKQRILGHFPQSSSRQRSRRAARRLKEICKRPASVVPEHFQESGRRFSVRKCDQEIRDAAGTIAMLIFEIVGGLLATLFIAALCCGDGRASYE